MQASRARLFKEYKEVQREKTADPNIQLVCDNTNIFKWNALVKGSPETPFEGGVFQIALVVPEQYPLQPPHARFLTKIFHPNVHFKTGEICLDILKNAWSPAWTLQSVCRAIIALMAHPEPDSPLNCDSGTNAKLEFVDEIFGPESLEFDSLGRGPYTGLADGRIVRWMDEDVGWQTFATVTKNWSEKRCIRGTDSTTAKQWKLEKDCGRPLRLKFDKEIGNLYIADAYYGLLVVGNDQGGIATPLATHVAAGDPILFANDLDITQMVPSF